MSKKNNHNFFQKKINSNETETSSQNVADNSFSAGENSAVGEKKFVTSENPSTNENPAVTGNSAAGENSVVTENSAVGENSPVTENLGTNEKNSELKKKYLEMLKKYGIILLVILVMAGILLLFSLLGKNINKRALLSSVNQTLAAYCEKNNFEKVEAEQWENKKIAFHTNYVLFPLEKNLKNFDYVFMVRISSIYGPVSAVYLFDSKNKIAEFADFSDMTGTAKSYINDTIKSSQILYWSRRLPNIFENLSSRNFGF